MENEPPPEYARPTFVFVEEPSEHEPLINPREVERIFRECLFEDDEPTDSAVIAEGIVDSAGFHPQRLLAHRDEVIAMLRELPTEFMQSGGGGWSFLNGCQDRNGTLWTGMQQTVMRLLQLGIALDLVDCQIPREMWRAFPGGMPYYIINDKKFSVEVDTNQDRSD